MKKSKELIRTKGTRRYKKLFFLSTEGKVTEPEYFKLLESKEIRIKPLNGKHPQPLSVLNAMEQHIKNKPLKNTDEAWLVIDKDNWTDDEINKLHRWSQQNDNYGLALSNPSFEYWLLLHFEDGSNKENCLDCLKKHIPAYNKHIDSKNFPLERIKKATERAKKRDKPPCSDWPKNPGVTTVYKLVEKLLECAQ